MIHTAKQLKDKVKNMSGGNSEVAQALIRTYFMERFLERVSVSEYGFPCFNPLRRELQDLIRQI